LHRPPSRRTFPEPLFTQTATLTMSPTVFQYQRFRFFFFSREEPRLHIHVQTPEGEAKYWLEPQIELAVNKGIRQNDLKTIEKHITDRIHELKDAWHKHFRR
jgi:hypothetical protein